MWTWPSDPRQCVRHKSVTSLNCLEWVFVLPFCMSFRRTSLCTQPRAPHPFSVCFRRTPDGERFTPSDAALSSLLSYFYKRLHPQLLSFDTHANGRGIVATRVYSSTLCSLFRSLCKERKYLLSLQRVAHSLQKTPGCTLVLRNAGIAPSFLLTFLLRYTRLVASRSTLPWTSASPRPTPPSQI